MEDISGAEWGRSSSLYVRGTESRHVTVLIDGVPARAGIGNAIDIGQLPVSLVQRIEYIRGPRFGGVRFWRDWRRRQYYYDEQ